MKANERFALAKAAGFMVFFTIGSVASAAAGNIGLAYFLILLGIGFTFHALNELPPIIKNKKKRSK